MKYFLLIGEDTIHVSYDFALALYRDSEHLNFYEDRTFKEVLESGDEIRISTSGMIAWGEDITDEELFRRKLVGTVREKVKSK